MYTVVTLIVRGEPAAILRILDALIINPPGGHL
jgi:hypothetical protein